MLIKFKYDKGYFVNYCNKTFHILAVLGTNWLEKNPSGIATHKNCVVVTPNPCPTSITVPWHFCVHMTPTSVIQIKTNNSFEFCVEALNRINFSIITKPNFLHCHFEWIKVTFEWIKVTHILAITQMRTRHFSNPPLHYN